MGARTVALTAYRTNGTAAQIRIGFAAPCREDGHMVRLLGEKIAKIDAGDGIDLMRLDATGIARMDAKQTALTRPDAHPPVNRLLDRLAARLTPARLARPGFRESHIPERAGIYQPAFAPVQVCEPSARTFKPPRPPLLLERPEPIEILAEVPEGPPLRMTWRRTTRRIVRAEGPERIAPEWWLLAAASHRTRDYYRIEDEAGVRYWVFRSGLYQHAEEEEMPRWYLQGVTG
jgi:protein ImuB